MTAKVLKDVLERVATWPEEAQQELAEIALEIDAAIVRLLARPAMAHREPALVVAPVDALLRLEQKGWIASDWRTTENNRRAKYYTLTKAGRKALDREAAQWERLAGAISLIVRAV